MAEGIAENYPYERNIPQLFESLMTALVYHKPKDPITFLQSCLEKARAREGRQYSWNSFITTAETRSRNAFSLNKPLPPIGEPAPHEEAGERMEAGEEKEDKERINRTEKGENSDSVAVCEAHDDKMVVGVAALPSLENKPLVFVLGGPGSGKGTQCERLVGEFGLTHLSAGDLLREEVARGSPQGHSIQETMREGRLVPPEVTIGLLRSAMLSQPDAVGFLVDGFPRELSQAHMFENQVCACRVDEVYCEVQELFKELLAKH